MADHLRDGALASVLLIGLALALPSAAQVPMADPTRPPPGVERGEPQPDVAGSLLQSVLIPKKGRPLAVIGGQTVPLGGKYGESTLVRVTERDVVLEGPEGVERLLLTPAAEKTMLKKSPARQARE